MGRKLSRESHTPLCLILAVHTMLATRLAVWTSLWYAVLGESGRGPRGEGSLTRAVRVHGRADLKGKHMPRAITAIFKGKIP